MRLFSVKEHKDQAEEKATLTRSQLLFMSDGVVKATQELNKLRDAIKQEIALKKQVIEEAIAPLQAQKAELERAIASAENRRKEMWLPFKKERGAFTKREEEIFAKEASLGEKELLTEKRRKEYEYAKERMNKKIHDAQQVRNAHRRAIVELQKHKETLKDSENWIRSESNRLSHIEKELAEKSHRLEKDRYEFETNIIAQKTFIEDLKEEVRLKAELVRQDREKLRLAIQQAKQRYGVNPKGFKQ